MFARAAIFSCATVVFVGSLVIFTFMVAKRPHGKPEPSAPAVAVRPAPTVPEKPKPIAKLPPVMAAPPKQEKAQKELKRLTGGQLWNEYGKNIIDADREYLDAPVELTIRGEIKKGRDGYYIAVPITTNVDYSAGVICVIRNGEANRFSKVTDRTTVRVRGVCKGRFDDSSSLFGYRVDVADCVLTEIIN